jgi:hypothetical protein
MTVTQPVTQLGSATESRAAAVYVPDLVVQKLSMEADYVVAQYKLGTPPEQWMNEPLKEEARTLLMGLPVEKESYQVHDTLFLTMRQEKRVLAPGALRDFFAITRSDGVAAFIQKYGLFKHPGRWEPEIRVSIEDFMRERRHMHSLLRI